MEELKLWLLENIFSILTSILGGGSLLGWIQERKKRKIEEKQLTSDALKSMQDAYDRFTQDSLERYNILKEEVDDLKVKLINVTTELKAERERLRIEREKFKIESEKYKQLEEEYNILIKKVSKIESK